MTIGGILSSPTQRRFLIVISALLIIFCFVAVFILYIFTTDTRGWNILIALLVEIVASATFASFSALYLYYFFTDPFDVAAATQLLATDIGAALEDIASRATEYKVYVRTGRHFRAIILPLLAATAARKRIPIRVEIILLDFRDQVTCEKYASFRQEASFDKQLWSLEYVQTEVIATILRAIEVSKASSTFIEIDLYLSRRLSTFRIEGTSDAIIVTREDPADNAARYRRSDPHFGAFLKEFSWIRQEADRVSVGRRLPQFREMFPDFSEERILAEAQAATAKGSPYVR
jgi:hypothetical protein